MFNALWLLLIAAGITVAALGGNTEVIGAAAFTACGDCVSLCLSLAGLMAMFMGIMQIAEEAGLVAALARLCTPLLARLFPEIPKNHPAFSDIVMNFAANLLGMGNAATPFGLKAMEKLQELNSKKGEASPSMITFLLLNTSCVTLIPSMIIGLRAEAGSSFPEEIIVPTILAGTAALIFALLLDRVCRRLYFKR
ncbi:MAG: nucleoside recognition domain-containing protein [Clostridia bacterium]|nr:nucleoside recognition domain-containing protein [Clostridia bacterium]